MQTVLILDPILIGGTDHAVGDIVNVPKREARYAIAHGHAREVKIEERDQIAAFEDGIATAVPGGKRPGRRRSPNSK